MPSKRRRMMVLLVVVAVLALDQATKAWALATLQDRVVPLLPTVQLRLTYNSGFSFSIGAQHGPLVGVVVVIIVGLLAWVALRERHLPQALLFGAVLGGALGNVVDRVVRADTGPLSGRVVDFIAVTWYAVFNVADIFVVCGAIMLALIEVRRPQQPETADNPVVVGGVRDIRGIHPPPR